MSKAPEALRYFPISHGVQDAVPPELLYVPEGHATHGPPSLPENPLLQRQSVTRPLSAAEFELAGHCVHAEAPTDENVPARHFSHSKLPAFALYQPDAHGEHELELKANPLAHMHAEADVLFLGDH